ncbi:hypothetical protein ACFSE0_11210 [Ochrobactrum teleogrylli]|uniref:Uncharacterized protein n=1 Tax=Ochrobactrum teleogrylli TaxID=2479765 RepID=A0ABY2XZU5_9HYPH|nr:hypothetical protein [[Ochrobactrum] teleogrylli]TNV09203.1 hypothetical protein FIC94_22215 [[Ochrobactrum] teleogrylli]
MPIESGILVAFDRFGQHFAYARQYDDRDCSKQSGEKRQKAEALQADASRRGGKVMLLSPEDFDRLIMMNVRNVGEECRRSERPLNSMADLFKQAQLTQPAGGTHACLESPKAPIGSASGTAQVG